jgi:hypothetical protein
VVLDAAGVRYEAVNANDGADGQRLYEAAGSPSIPAVLVDGDPYPIHHPAQIGTLLGLELEPRGSIAATCWDLHGLLERWIDAIQSVPFDVMLEPTESRGRSIRNLTVNVFRPISYIPDAWWIQEFVWYTGEADHIRFLDPGSVERVGLARSAWHRPVATGLLGSGISAKRLRRAEQRVEQRPDLVGVPDVGRLSGVERRQQRLDEPARGTIGVGSRLRRGAPAVVVELGLDALGHCLVLVAFGARDGELVGFVVGCRLGGRLIRDALARRGRSCGVPCGGCLGR